MVNLFRKSYFSKEEEAAIVLAIESAEAGTSGEICVHLVRRCGSDVLAEAKKVFGRLGMHRTQLRNGVLLLVCLQSRRFALYGDQGIYERVPSDFWDSTRDTMLGHFRQDQIKDGIVAGVQSAGEQLKRYFPVTGNNPNELLNKITQS